MVKVFRQEYEIRNVMMNSWEIISNLVNLQKIQRYKYLYIKGEGRTSGISTLVGGAVLSAWGSGRPL